MIIPEKVKIGVSEYEVRKVPYIDKGNLLAEIDYSNLVIQIDENYPKQTQELSFMHELVHGLFYELGEEELRRNERLVDQLGRLIYQVFRDNDLNINE